MKKEHLLAIRFSAMGDVAMTVPVIYSLARQYPDVRITMLSRPFARPFFEGLAPNVNFMEADVKREYHGLKGLNRLYRRLTAKQFTAVADLHSVLRSDYLRLRFNLGRFRVAHIDKHRRERKRLVRPGKQGVRRPLASPFDNYREVFARLGYPIERITFTSLFGAGKGDLSVLPTAIGPVKGEGELWIGIAPTAAHQGKIYPLERMEQVVTLLARRHPKARLFLFGRGRQEDELFARWAAAVPQCTHVARHLETMQQELVLMSHLDVMLSMDSANMHLASLAGTTVVSVWGATHPMAGFLGWGQHTEHCVQADMPCRPCSIYGQKPCRYGDYRCLTAITPQQVAERVERVVSKKENL